MVLQRCPSVKNKRGTAAGLIPAAVFFAPKGKAAVQKLLESGVAAQNADGSVIVPLEEYGFDVPLLVQKSNGAPLYATTDLATIVERMKLIQGLQGQRPITVRLVDELVRVTPPTMYLTKFTRTGDKFTIEGKAESPNTVAELLRNLEASPWYRNAFMNSFLAAEEKKDKTAASLVPRVEENYGSFVVTVDLGEIGTTAEADPAASGVAQ